MYVFQLNDNKIDASIKVHQASITAAGSYSSAQKVRKWAYWSEEFGKKHLPSGDWGSLVTYLQKDRLAKSSLILWRLHWIDWNPKKSWKNGGSNGRQTNTHTHTQKYLGNTLKQPSQTTKTTARYSWYIWSGVWEKIPCKHLIWFNV